MGSAPEDFHFDISEVIRQMALALPDADEGTSCVNRAFSAGGKNFAFLGEKDNECRLRLKLEGALEDVTARAEEDPDTYQVGTHGWTLVVFEPDSPPVEEDLATWVTESFRLLAPKHSLAKLDEG